MRPIIPLLAASTAAANPTPLHIAYDYVIAGAGTAGLVVANQLSDQQGVTVAVIEPGADERQNPNVTDPSAFSQAFGTHVDWAYTTVPQARASQRVLNLPQGKAWGGTSTINGMTYIRGNRAEIDAWEALGNPGWNWDSLLPYAKKSESYTVPSATQRAAGARYRRDYHGFNGPVHVGYPSGLRNGSFAPNILGTWGGLGLTHNGEVNSGDVRGYSMGPQTLGQEGPDGHDVRFDAARAYLHLVEGRENLKIITGTVRKIIWAEGKGRNSGLLATGIEVLNQDGTSTVIKATKEVILSAGAMRTPLILEASGIGNPRILDGLGIETKVDLHGVGENLSEQPTAFLAYSGTLEPSASAYHTFVTAGTLFGANLSAVEKATRDNLAKWAKAAVDASAAGGVKASALETILHIQHDLIFKQNITFGELVTVSAPGGLLASQYWIIWPFSRGSVHLGGLNAINKPIIDPRLFLADFDLTAIVAVGRLAEKFWASDPIKASVSGRLVPSPDVLAIGAGDAEWYAYLRDTVNPNAHSLGTASMMSRELGGVVDPELKVYGTANVRVVDASVLPMQFSGHLTSIIYAVAERASDIIKRAGK